MATVSTAVPTVAAEAAEELRALFDTHHDFVWRSVRRLGIGSDAVDDVVQEVFIVAGRKLDAFEGRSSVRTWLFGIAMRVAHTHRRSQQRRLRRAAAYAETTPTIGDPYARADAVDLLHRLLDDLDDDRRAAFVLADLEGLTAAEIAEELGANPNTISSRIRAARQHLERAVAQHVEREGGEPWNR
jgi:RNA polymerase sigma-70 factor (ECF subfamily)